MLQRRRPNHNSDHPTTHSPRSRNSKGGKRKLASLAIAFAMAIPISGLTPTDANAAACTVTAPNIHISYEVKGRFNFKPTVTCRNGDPNLTLESYVQIKLGGQWVTEHWEKKVLNRTPTYIRISLSRPCMKGTWRGQARYRQNSGQWSSWKYSNVYSIDGCNAMGSWKFDPPEAGV